MNEIKICLIQWVSFNCQKHSSLYSFIFRLILLLQQVIIPVDSQYRAFIILDCNVYSSSSIKTGRICDAIQYIKLLTHKFFFDLVAKMGKFLCNIKQLTMKMRIIVL